MNARFTLSILLVTFITAFLMSACERHGAVSDLQEYVNGVKAVEQKKKRVNVMAEIKVPSMVSYHGDSLRSPFNAVIPNMGAGSMSNPLLAYPLNVLRFVGTMSQGDVAFAFVMTPDNMVYQVKVGDLIGDHRGKVISIQPNRMNVVEKDSENGGAMMQRIVTLELRDGL